MTKSNRVLIDKFTLKGLTGREAEVAEMVSTGLSNKEVADQLFVTEKTVKFHLTNIYKKLEVKNRMKLMALAVSWGIAFNFSTEPEPIPTPAVPTVGTDSTLPIGAG